ncbi:hypothetical protein AURDEDRAFT_130638 [Auricularia subglabra TFB-10046 SS5]|uniref:Uncharacterized protein n=1 Tax=Auricularia subglabra (strain TFB-10046 / SS5) TaxID=717982 RepID=J0D879_AURST|nr:hypothetical protein AURDEDRAFT_130638 [Auricularia subglabra TFB-10046 SS5]
MPHTLAVALALVQWDTANVEGYLHGAYASIDPALREALDWALAAGWVTISLHDQAPTYAVVRVQVAAYARRLVTLLRELRDLGNASREQGYGTAEATANVQQANSLREVAAASLCEFAKHAAHLRAIVGLAASTTGEAMDVDPTSLPAGEPFPGAALPPDGEDFPEVPVPRPGKRPRSNDTETPDGSERAVKKPRKTRMLTAAELARFEDIERALQDYSDQLSDMMSAAQVGLDTVRDCLGLKQQLMRTVAILLCLTQRRADLVARALPEIRTLAAQIAETTPQQVVEKDRTYVEQLLARMPTFQVTSNSDRDEQ